MKIEKRHQLWDLLNYHYLPHTICEVGVAEGKFTETLFNWSPEKLYLIDIWERVPFIPGCASYPQEWHDENYARIQKLFGDKPNVTILKGFSYNMVSEIPDGSLGLCYVDADHTYFGAKSDAQLFWPKLAPGGIMAFHDYANSEYGVGQAVKEFSREVNTAVNVIIEDGDVANIGCWIRK